jgi:hypothetical protein
MTKTRSSTDSFITTWLPKTRSKKVNSLTQASDVFKMGIDSQINGLVYFGFIVKNQEFNVKKHPAVEFSQIEKIGNLNVIGFAFDNKSLG